MTRLTKRDRDKIEKVRQRKERTRDKVLGILTVICKDNPDVFKKTPEARVKKLERIEQKMKEISGCNVNNFEEHIRDIAGARVTCCLVNEIPTVESLIKKHPEVKRRKVLRRHERGPDQDGYRGHHLEITVAISYENESIEDTCEIQIRTLAEDLWAVLSHRDFYKAPFKPPLPVRNDMLTLSKQLEVVDGLAMSLRKRIREEVDKKAREQANKLAERDMLTPENVMDLVHKTFRQRIPIDFAYEIVQYTLSSGVVSLQKYRKLITSQKYRRIIDDSFNKFAIKPRLEDYLLGPTLLETQGMRVGKSILVDTAREQRELTMLSVEKGVDVSKEELEKEAKTSQPTRRKGKK